MEATKTDLRILLECLKYQMKWPGSQKQALLTIISICKQSGQYVEFFREIGGISFIYNLSKSSTFSQVKETALFTLASLAELHESCKQTLCKEETFRDLAQHLEQKMPLTEKRVAVYMLSVLVANNRCGQTLAKTSRCIETLLNLFRQSFPDSNDSYEQLQLWATVSSALCGSVNNPQNEENQNVCMRVFPLVKTWLQEVALPRAELAQPICSFIGMTVANNPCAQEYFVSVGGLNSLSDTLTRVLSQSAHSPAACKMATVITKTLSACISNNEQLVSSLSELRVIPGLLCLLSSPNLDQQDKLAVVLTIGHLTDACVEHQSQLLSAGGLPVMISLLTEASDEEIRKAAVFVLHTCKRITESLGAGMSSMDLQDCDLERHRQSAGEILQRIQHLEKKMGVKLWERDIESQQRSMQRSASSVECNEAMWECSVMRKVKGHHRVCEELHITPAGTLEHPITNEIPYNQESLQCVSSDECLSPAQVTHFKRSSWEKGKEREHEQMRENERSDNQERRREREIKKRDMEIKSERVAKRLKMMNLDSDVNGNKHLQHCSTPARRSRDTQRPDIFRHPDPMKRNQCTRTLLDDEMSLCSELLDREILKPPSPNKPRNLRCAGCVKHMNEMDSRSFGVVLRNCRFQCDFHQVLQEAEDRFKSSQQLEKSSHTLTRAHINTHGKNREHSTCADEDNKRSKMEKHRLSHQPSDGCFRLTPLRRPCETYSFRLTPLRRPCETYGPDMEENMDHRHLKRTSECWHPKNTSCSHRERRNWSADELCYLKMGMKRFGRAWNSILWTYPFQPGRTNVDLAKKYRHMQKTKAQGVDLSHAGDV
ncbi:telomere repeats-binding bouquet formation protein 1 isoform X1 [Megalobrama amblycephala]|uniref:telomere repeats-binding bouquet formation protein 1 isoform X1 n=1 Tax=Megalobrama amblycephala TaxID=75352 RepID=UPI002013E259|nr:telomere repeats-binding bouquet formation protein 1 isoform X1 [Megalobrama amblycephala]XP_048023671.1 telomere repeats-binding bouquet formation protein 1 isoform X1 [Megalobrama amblycephala]